eukprot:CAMPEP_0184698224 /NCGR_PEP_ID=MMETSP0313-20130426/4922_1 /TAXON_ID=2792 /ORGANISM="Porphyridium aerugineum, Strain SAG 1380-2" /LENGTH=1400 /DNA_ID=CAMNT_0027157139 /DNA_START=342 /DNA_END=4544 /DNA_ORIENTATION=+
MTTTATTTATATNTNKIHIHPPHPSCGTIPSLYHKYLVDIDTPQQSMATPNGTATKHVVNSFDYGFDPVMIISTLSKEKQKVEPEKFTWTKSECMEIGDGMKMDVALGHSQNKAHMVLRYRHAGGDDVNFQKPDEVVILHWGIATKLDDTTFCRPPDSMIPENSQDRPGKASMRTPFDPTLQAVHIQVDEQLLPEKLLFLPFIEASHGCREQWFKPKNGAGSFKLDLDPMLSEAEIARRMETLKLKEKEELEMKKEEERVRKEKEEAEKKKQAEIEKKLEEETAKREARKATCLKYIADIEAKYEIPEKLVYDMGVGDFFLCSVRPKNQSKEIRAKEPAKVVAVTNMTMGGGELILHWGLKIGTSRGWTEPPKQFWPPNTIAKDGKAVQTTFTDVQGGEIRVISIDNFPIDAAGLMCVLFAPPNKWFNKPSGGDMYLTLLETPPLPGLDKDVSKKAVKLAENIVEVEMEYESWTLMHRYNHASHQITSTVDDDTDCWSTLYVWLRYSQLRVLDWQRSYNTQPRQLSAAQMNFVTLLAKKYLELGDQRWNIRMSMSCVGRGGSGDMGQRIRDDILHICRFHRGWGHGSMMEQWHQKLHNNTNPDDVHICNALLAFWHSNGNINEYWRVLGENGVTKERMASYEQPITSEPDFPGHLKDTMLHELGRYGELLKTVHLGTDLDTIVNHCRWFMHGDTKSAVDGYLHARWNAGFVDKLRSGTNARQSIANQLKRPGVSDDQARDLLFMDIAIDGDVRRLVEGGEHHDNSLWTHLALVQTAAESLALSEAELESATLLTNISRELTAVLQKLEYYGESEDVGLRAAASMNMARNSLTGIVDRYKRYIGSMSYCLGQAFHAEKHLVDIFVEESIRGSSAYALSMLLRKAEPHVRRVASLGPWTIIAPRDKPAHGEVRVFNHLRECMTEKFKKDTIIIANICDGDEDVPAHVAFVVIGSTVDVLSHVAVRARNEHHGLVGCMDAEEMERLRSYVGCVVSAKFEGENFVITLDDSVDLARVQSKTSSGNLVRLKSKGLVTHPSGLQTPPHMLVGERGRLGSMHSFGSFQELAPMKRSGSILSEVHLSAPWAIRPSEYNLDLVGSKSMNLGKLMALKLPSWIHIPTSVTIPNGVLKKVFRDPKNTAVKTEYSRLRTEIYKAKPTDVSLCPVLREVIMQLQMPDGFAAALRGVLDELECDNIDETLPHAWEAVKGVWASTWNERAHLARRKMNMYTEDVDMAVLCQKIVDADYAFVIHTNNPITGDRDEIYGEIVVGLGETLVSNAPGQALGFVVGKSDLENPSIKSYPSKQFALKGGKFIFRSDSNSEDLEGFAGAGLHDSIPLEPNRKVELDYSKEPLMLDDDLRKSIMVGVGKIGKIVEETMGGYPQDIEGCYKDGKFYVVQSRPQM